MAGKRADVVAFSGLAVLDGPVRQAPAGDACNSARAAQSVRRPPLAGKGWGVVTEYDSG
jgi:hypothetical protein